MSAVDALASIGAWALLLLGAAVRIVRFGQGSPLANWLLSLSVALFYYWLVLRVLFSGLDLRPIWEAETTRIEVAALLVPAGLFCCWFGKSRWVRALGAAAIAMGLIMVFPGLYYTGGPLEAGNGRDG